jgi:putative hydrolase of the HAD superfamily
LAVLSNNPYAPTGLEVLGMTGHFDAIITLEEASGLAKPHPHAFASLATALDLAPEEVVYVGDSLVDDVAGALAAGMVAIWVDRVGTGLAAPEGAWRVGSLAELPGLLEKM